ncbi:MAG: hypothetical protein HC848_04155 [Limnobacter sp.]|nr:hypothetical protein [Limnobacter sp.]
MKHSFKILVCGFLAVYGLNAVASEQTTAATTTAAVQWMLDTDLAKTEAAGSLVKDPRAAVAALAKKAKAKPNGRILLVRPPQLKHSK